MSWSGTFHHIAYRILKQYASLIGYGNNLSVLVKVVKNESEEVRIKIWHLRDESNKKINQQEESGEITEDGKFKLKEQTQKSIDKANGDIEAMLEKKTKEIEE